MLAKIQVFLEADTPVKSKNSTVYFVLDIRT